MLWGVVFLLYVYWGTPTPIWGYLPLITPPTLLCWLPVHCYSQVISSYVGAFPLLLKGLGVFPPSLGEVWGAHQLSAVHMFILIHIL